MCDMNGTNFAATCGAISVANCCADDNSASISSHAFSKAASKMDDVRMSIADLLEAADAIRKNVAFLDECKAKLDNGTLGVRGAKLARAWWAFVLQINEHMVKLRERKRDNPKFTEFIDAIHSMQTYQCSPMSSRVVQPSLNGVVCDFTRIETYTPVSIAIDGRTFICDRGFHDAYLSRIVEYARFPQRCVAFPFANVDEAVQVFLEDEAVVLQACR